jgi:hypothetical protein
MRQGYKGTKVQGSNEEVTHRVPLPGEPALSEAKGVRGGLIHGKGKRQKGKRQKESIERRDFWIDRFNDKAV